MIKVLDITQEQLNSFLKASNQLVQFKKIVGIDPNDKTKRNVGDTCIQAFDAKMLEVYKDEFHGRDIYYIIAKVLNDRLAFAYSLYITQ